MRSVLRQAIPSMFHRRLLLLAAVSCGLMALLAMQTARLTTGAERDERRDILRKHLEQADYTPTSRGRIYDRKGRLLAEDRPGWEIAVSFRVLSGNWAYVKAREAAQRRVGRSAWRDLTLDEQDDLARQYVRPYLVQIEQLRVTLAELGNVPPEEIEARQREIVRWVQTMAANATARKRDHQVKTLKKSSGDSADPELSWAEVYVEVAEEFQSHPVLTDVPPETVTWIDQFIAKAQQERELEPDEPGEYEVWLEVTPRRLRLRRYPWESRTFALDRSTLPGSLRNDAPLEMTVEGIGRHVLGSLRPIHKGDAWWDRRPFVVRDPETGERRVDLSGYRPRDPIGRLGIERSMEATLRGTRGRRVLHLDTGETEVVRPAPGSDVHLSLDIQLQMRLQALMSHDPAVGLMRSQTWHNSGYDADETPHNPRPGDPLNGAAVVLDIDNGEVLAAVSVPGTTLDDLDDPGSPYYRDFDNRVSIFRPVGYRYDPGSTNKPLVLAAAITDGVVGPDEALDCSQGHLWEHAPNIFREWIYRPRYGLQTFGTIDGVEALTVSSNVFFGQLAQRFGESQGYGRVVEWFNRFGFGRRAGVGLLEEIAGDLPPPGARVTEADAAYMAIGEGQLSVTPLQVANAHATLARGGLFIPPTFVQERSRPEPRQAEQLHLSPAASGRALAGMEASANYAGTSGADRGTTYNIRFPDGTYERLFTLPGVKVMAKSGTAQAPPLRRLLPDGGFDRDGLVIRTGYHAWVVALVQPDGEARPTHAIACVVEYGGSGGRTAGPIVAQIIRALAVEGYLGDTPQAAATPRPSVTLSESPSRG